MCSTQLLPLHVNTPSEKSMENMLSMATQTLIYTVHVIDLDWAIPFNSFTSHIKFVQNTPLPFIKSVFDPPGQG